MAFGIKSTRGTILNFKFSNKLRPGSNSTQQYLMLTFQTSAAVNSKASNAEPTEDGETTLRLQSTNSRYVTVSQLVYIIADVFHVLKQVYQIDADCLQYIYCSSMI